MLKLSVLHELQAVIRGFIALLESGSHLGTTQNVPNPDKEMSGNQDEESSWMGALKWCPTQLLDLINSKACRGENSRYKSVDES